MIEITITLQWWSPLSFDTKLLGSHEAKILVDDDLDAIEAAVATYAHAHAQTLGHSTEDQSLEWDYTDSTRAKPLNEMSLQQLFAAASQLG